MRACFSVCKWLPNLQWRLSLPRLQIILRTTGWFTALLLWRWASHIVQAVLNFSFHAALLNTKHDFSCESFSVIVRSLFYSNQHFESTFPVFTSWVLQGRKPWPQHLGRTPKFGKGPQCIWSLKCLDNCDCKTEGNDIFSEIDVFRLCHYHGFIALKWY